MTNHNTPITVRESNFIQKSKNKFGDHFDYSKVEYKNNSTPITLICKEHGEFQQRPSEHLNGKQCLACRKASFLLNKNNFLEKSKESHGYKYRYNYIPEKITSSTKITIECPQHGEFKQQASNHISGHGCPRCGGKRPRTPKKYREELQKIFLNSLWIPALEEIPKGTGTKISVYCYVHGWVETSVDILWKGENGCSKCSGKFRYDTETFITEAIKTHGHTYIYDKTNYINSTSKVTIKCPEHGYFEQNAHSHLRGHGCFICSKTKTKYSNREDKGQIYVLDFENENEKFTKIGVTKDIKNRLPHFPSKVYDIKVVDIFESTLVECYEREKYIHNELEEFKYTPNLKFGGSSECFDISDYSILFEFFKNI